MTEELSILCCDNCGDPYKESTMQLIEGPELVVCTPCNRKYRRAIRESWKQEECAKARLLTALELRARIPECLSRPTVYMPPVKRERSMSRFEIWKDHNEFKGFAGFTRGGGYRGHIG